MQCVSFYSSFYTIKDRFKLGHFFYMHDHLWVELLVLQWQLTNSTIAHRAATVLVVCDLYRPDCSHVWVDRTGVVTWLSPGNKLYSVLAHIWYAPQRHQLLEATCYFCQMFVKQMLSDVRDTCDRNTFWEVRYKLTQPSNLSFTSCVRSSSSPSFIQALTMFLSSCWNLNVLPTFENRPTLSDSAPNVWNTSNSVALSLHSSLQIGYTIFIHDPMAIDVCLQSLS